MHLHFQLMYIQAVDTRGRLFKRRLTSVYQNHFNENHFQFAQRFYLTSICSKQFQAKI